MQILGWFRRKPTDRMAAKADAGAKAVATAAVSGSISRALAAVLLALGIGLASAQLQLQEFALLSLLLASTSVLGFLDLGITNGLINSTSAALERGQTTSLRSTVSSATVAATSIAVLMTGLLLVAIWLMPPESLPLGNEVPSTADYRICLSIFAMTLCISPTMQIGTKLALATQRPRENAAYQLLGAALSFVGVAAAFWGEFGVIWYCVAFFVTPVVLAGIQTGTHLLSRTSPMRFSLRSVDTRGVRRELRAGAPFFFLSITSSCTYHSQPIILAYTSTPAQVAIYSIALRMFGFLQASLMGALMQMWASFHRAVVDSSRERARACIRATKRSVGLPATIGCSLIALAGPWIADVWVGQPADQLLILYPAFGVWMAYRILEVAMSFVVAAFGALRFQVTVSVITSIGVVGFGIVSAQQGGALFLVVSSLLVSTLLSGLPFASYIRRRQGSWTEPVEPRDLTTL